MALIINKQLFKKINLYSGGFHYCHKSDRKSAEQQEIKKIVGVMIICFGCSQIYEGGAPFILTTMVVVLLWFHISHVYIMYVLSFSMFLVEWEKKENKIR